MANSVRYLTDAAATKKEANILARIAEQLTDAELDYLKQHVRTVNGRLQWRRMTKGNMKIKGSVLTYSMPPISTCPNHSRCAKTCFALKAMRAYPSARHAWEVNEKLAREQLHLLEVLLVAQIEEALGTKKAKEHGLYVRIHVSGDFFSQDYLNMWVRVASRFPEVRFWAYTKVAHLLDFSQVPENLNVINSFIEGKFLNYGVEDYVNRLVERFGAFKCPATGGRGVKCIEDCKYCLYGKKPVFVIH